MVSYDHLRRWWSSNLAIVTTMIPGREYQFVELIRALDDYDFGLLAKPCERTVHRHLAWLLDRKIVLARGNASSWWVYECLRRPRHRYLEVVPNFVESVEPLDLLLKSLPSYNQNQHARRARRP